MGLPDFTFFKRDGSARVSKEKEAKSNPLDNRPPFNTFASAKSLSRGSSLESGKLMSGVPSRKPKVSSAPQARSLRGAKPRTPSEHSECDSLGYVCVDGPEQGLEIEGGRSTVALSASTSRQSLCFHKTHQEQTAVRGASSGTSDYVSENRMRVSNSMGDDAEYNREVDGHLSGGGSGSGEGARRLASQDLQSGTRREMGWDQGLEGVEQDDHNGTMQALKMEKTELKDTIQALKMENAALRGEVKSLEERIETLGIAISNLTKPRTARVGVEGVDRATGGADEHHGDLEERKSKRLLNELEAERHLRREAEKQEEQLRLVVKQLRHEKDEALQQVQGQVSSSVVTALKVRAEKAEARAEKAEARLWDSVKANESLKSGYAASQDMELEARDVIKRWVHTLSLALTSDIEESPLPVVLTEVLNETERHCSEDTSAAQEELAEARRTLRKLGAGDDTRGVPHMVQRAYQEWSVELSKVQGEKEALMQQATEARRKAQSLAVATPAFIERSTLADLFGIVGQEIMTLTSSLTGSKKDVTTMRQEMEEKERQWKREQGRLAQEATDLEQELGRVLAEKARVEEEKRQEERQKEVERREKAEVLQREQQLRAYVLGLERLAQEPPKPAYTTPLYVTFNSIPQHQYEPNVQHIARLLNDPPAQIKAMVKDPSELLAAKGPKVLLYVTYCPNPRLSADRDRVQAFVDLPGVKVVFLILKRGVGSQLTDLKTAREMVPCLPPLVLHYTISGEGLEQPDTPAGQMNARSSDELQQFLRDVFPPPPVARPIAPPVSRPAFLPPTLPPAAPQRAPTARPVSPELTGPSTSIAPYGPTATGGGGGGGSPHRSRWARK